MSSELKSAFTGRQYVAGAVQSVDLAVDVGAETEILLGTLPEGAIITSGWLQTLVAGTAGAVVIESRDPVTGSVISTYATGAAATPAKTDYSLSGVPHAEAQEIWLTSAVDQSAGVGTLYNYMEYVVVGRSQFSEG